MTVGDARRASLRGHVPRWRVGLQSRLGWFDSNAACSSERVVHFVLCQRQITYRGFRRASLANRRYFFKRNAMLMTRTLRCPCGATLTTELNLSQPDGWHVTAQALDAWCPRCRHKAVGEPRPASTSDATVRTMRRTKRKDDGDYSPVGPPLP